MKDHFEIGHLTKYDAFSVNRDQVVDLDIWFKIQSKFFISFVTTVKIPSFNFYLKEAEMKIAMFAHFKDCHGNHKKF